MAATKKTTTKEPAKKVATPAKKSPAKATAAKKAAPAPAAADHADGIPAPRGTTKDGIVYTKDFDVKFLKAQHDALVAERAALTGQATRLEDEANSLIEDGEMGDVQLTDDIGAVAGQVLQVLPATIGPRLGKHTQDVIRAVKAGDWTLEGERVVAGGHWLEPGEFTLALVADAGSRI